MLSLPAPLASSRRTPAVIAPPAVPRQPVTRLQHLPVELLLDTASHLDASGRLALCFHHPKLQVEADAAALSVKAGNACNVEVLTALLAAAHSPATHETPRVLTAVILRASRLLHQTSNGLQEERLQGLLLRCLAAAQHQPDRVRWRVLSLLLLRLPHSLCLFSAFQPGLHGRFATGLLDAVTDGAARGARVATHALACAGRDITDTINLEQGPGACGDAARRQRQARAAQVTGLLDRPGALHGRMAGRALETVARLVGYYFRENIDVHVPTLMRCMLVPGGREMRAGLHGTGELLGDIHDAALRLLLMQAMVASVVASVQGLPEPALRDHLNGMVSVLRRPARLLPDTGRAVLDALLRQHGWTGRPL